MPPEPPYVRLANAADAEIWLTLRCALWDDPPDEHRAVINAFFAGAIGEPQAVLIAFDTAQRGIGLAELSIRPYAEGCDTQSVAYLEGWYVVPDCRGQGVGRALMLAAETWGRSQGCREFASDAEVDNEVSRLAHIALGFEDVGLIRCFRKDLSPSDRP